MASWEDVVAALCDVWQALEHFLDGLLTDSEHGDRVDTGLVDFESLGIQGCEHLLPCCGRAVSGVHNTRRFPAHNFKLKIEMR